MRPLLIAGLCAAALQAYSPAMAADAPALEHGREVFERWCAPCHDPGPSHPGTAALAAKYKGAVPAELERRQNLTPAFVSGVVRHGISVMPIFRKTEISDDDLAALEAYLQQPHK